MMAITAHAMRKELRKSGEAMEMTAIWCTTAAVEGVGAPLESHIDASRTVAEKAKVKVVLDEFGDVFPAQLPKGA